MSTYEIVMRWATWIILLGCAVAYIVMSRRNRKRLSAGWTTEELTHKWSEHCQGLAGLLIPLYLGFNLAQYYPKFPADWMFAAAIALLFASKVRIWYRPGSSPVGSSALQQHNP